MTLAGIVVPSLPENALVPRLDGKVRNARSDASDGKYLATNLLTDATQILSLCYDKRLYGLPIILTLNITFQFIYYYDVTNKNVSISSAG